MNAQSAAKQIKNELNTDGDEADMIIEKAIAGGEIEDENQCQDWLSNRFIKNCVLIDETGYSKMCVNALKILKTTAATDYGSSRQRDMGQLWADMTRGYLGELAFALFLKKRWGIEAELGHELGKLDDYLPMDIHQVKKDGEQFRQPKLKIGIKAVKWNGIWLDIPGAQFEHSDLHVLVKVGTGRDHLFAFFKSISVFKDKVLKRGKEVGSLTEEEAEQLFENLPSFKPVPAYICGFAKKIGKYSNLSYKGRKGRKNYKITAWNGPIVPGDLDKIKELNKVQGSVKFEGIGEFSHDSGHLFNTGNLIWLDDEWKRICEQL